MKNCSIDKVGVEAHITISTKNKVDQIVHTCTRWLHSNFQTRGQHHSFLPAEASLKDIWDIKCPSVLLSRPKTMPRNEIFPPVPLGLAHFTLASRRAGFVPGILPARGCCCCCLGYCVFFWKRFTGRAYVFLNSFGPASTLVLRRGRRDIYSYPFLLLFSSPLLSLPVMLYSWWEAPRQ